MNNNEVKDENEKEKTEKNNKQNEIDSKNQKILDELKKLEEDLSEDFDKEKLAEAIDKISRMSNKPNLIGNIVAFGLAFINAFIACYIAYGIIYNHIHITKLNALLMNLSIAFILVLMQGLLGGNSTSFIGKIMALIFSYGVTMIAMCSLSNIGILFEVESFSFIMLYFLIEFIVFQMLGFLLTRQQIKKIVR